MRKSEGCAITLRRDIFWKGINMFKFFRNRSKNNSIENAQVNSETDYTEQDTQAVSEADGEYAGEVSDPEEESVSEEKEAFEEDAVSEEESEESEDEPEESEEEPVNPQVRKSGGFKAFWKKLFGGNKADDLQDTEAEEEDGIISDESGEEVEAEAGEIVSQEEEAEEQIEAAESDAEEDSDVILACEENDPDGEEENGEKKPGKFAAFWKKLFGGKKKKTEEDTGEDTEEEASTADEETGEESGEEKDSTETEEASEEEAAKEDVPIEELLDEVLGVEDLEDEPEEEEEPEEEDDDWEDETVYGDHLDKLVAVSSPLHWVLLTGGIFVVMAAIWWAIYGSVPKTEEARGILLKERKFTAVYANTSGMITQVNIAEGDTVQPGDVLYEVGSKADAGHIQELQERIRKVESVSYNTLTSDSYSDSSSYDDDDYYSRSGYNSSGSGSSSSSSGYRSSGNSVSRNSVSNNSAASTVRDTVKTNVSSSRKTTQISASYDVAEDQVTSDNQKLIDIKNQQLSLVLESREYEAKVEDLQERYKAKLEEVSDLKRKLENAESAYYSQVSSDKGSQVKYEFDTAVAEYSTAESALQAASKAYQDAVNLADAATIALIQAKDAYTNAKKYGTAQEKAAAKSAVADAQTANKRAQEKLSVYTSAKNAAETERNSKRSAYNTKKSAYESYVRTSGQGDAQEVRNSNAYLAALESYNMAYGELNALSNDLSEAEAMLSAVTENALEIKDNALKNQFEAEKKSVLDRLNRELSDYQKQLESVKIKAAVGGVVEEVIAQIGYAVSEQTQVAKICEYEAENLQAVYYLPLKQGKRIKEGMSVSIYPSVYPKEEYGYLTGTVLHVEKYVTSYDAVQERLRDSKLAELFEEDGPVMEIVCEITMDDTTVSGYEWSLAKGEEVELAEGTLLDGVFEIDSTSPISMLIPRLKDRDDSNGKEKKKVESETGTEDEIDADEAEDAEIYEDDSEDYDDEDYDDEDYDDEDYDDEDYDDEDYDDEDYDDEDYDDEDYDDEDYDDEDYDDEDYDDEDYDDEDYDDEEL